MSWNDENLTAANGDHDWWHATVSFPGSAGISPQAAVALASAMSGQRFHFLRKDRGLRLRAQHPVPVVLDRLVSQQLAASWTGGVYEPETAAFGGPAAMDAAHDLFCADSPAALAGTGAPGARERCILLICAMNRAAGLDPFETADVWAKVACLRPPASPPAPDRLDTAIATMRRLLDADSVLLPRPDPGWTDRATAYQDAGTALARLAAAGQLTRGLRAVLAHHAIFALNRSAVSAAGQAAAAWLAQHAVLGTGGL